jgi:predicted component of type VI protein secretion system
VDGERLEFRAFDDFHPDALVARLPVFERLRDLRVRLQNPRTSAAAIAELKGEAATTTETGASAPSVEGDQSTLERLLGRKSTEAAAQTSSAALNSIERLIRNAVAPHIVPAADPHLPGALAAVDLALGEVMRRVLHDPREWQPLDSAIAAQSTALRTGSAGPHVGLTVPRFLLRQPYGRSSDPIQAFSFEEQPPRPDHESFLWGNPAFACALVIARALQGSAVGAEIGTITDLPAFDFSSGDEHRLQPCAEVCLTETGIDAIVSRGVMPLVSFKDRNAIRLVTLQSIADPPAALLD